MDIQEKQARWALEKPLFEAEFIHSHLLQFFNFNENTGDYEIKSEFSEDEDKELAFEVLNTGWVMWLRAKRAKAQAVPEWISVEDELPTPNKTFSDAVIAWDGLCIRRIPLCLFNSASEVTHWMPIPQPPKAQEPAND